MDLNNVSSIVALLAALSVASERLVEIIKGFFPSLNKENPDAKKEDRRKSTLQILAVIAGITTACLASPAFPSTIPHDWMTTLALGLLASGGSGFWNSIQTYVNKAKTIKTAEAEVKKAEALPAKAAVKAALSAPA